MRTCIAIQMICTVRSWSLLSRSLQRPSKLERSTIHLHIIAGFFFIPIRTLQVQQNEMRAEILQLGSIPAPKFSNRDAAGRLLGQH